jgi:DNA-binding NarL/FixJ family response regulator
MQSRTIQIALVDDHSLFRKTLTHFLSGQNNLEVVIQATDVPDLFSKLRNFKAEILLMDIFMPKMDGTEALKILRQEFPSLKILVLSMSTDIGLVCDLLEAGIQGSTGTDYSRKRCIGTGKAALSRIQMARSHS